MRAILLPALTFITTVCTAQVKDTLSDPPIQQGIKAFIIGQQYKDTVDFDFLIAGFRIGLSDSSFKIKQFNLGWINNKRAVYHQMNIKGDSVNPAQWDFKLRDAYINADFFFDRIIVSKDGKDFAIRQFKVTARDLFKKHLTLNNPRICHDKKGRLHCYNDGTYRIHFIKNRLVSFSTIDSLLNYYEKEKKFLIKNPVPNQVNKEIISLCLKRKSLQIFHGSEMIELDSIPTKNLEFNGFVIQLKSGRYTDSVLFTLDDKKFLIEISKWPNREWYWEIWKFNGPDYFYLAYDSKKYRLDRLSIWDNRLRYGMCIYTRFHSKKGIWQLKSMYSEEQVRGDRIVMAMVPLNPSYYYEYNLFGTLKKKRVNGEIKYCNCD